jgi:hypothetical protein
MPHHRQKKTICRKGRERERKHSPTITNQQDEGQKKRERKEITERSVKETTKEAKKIYSVRK